MSAREVPGMSRRTFMSAGAAGLGAASVAGLAGGCAATGGKAAGGGRGSSAVTGGGAPAGRQIRVLAGDPPLDWSKITSFDQLRAIAGPQRDIHAASVVEKQVLGKG